MSQNAKILVTFKQCTYAETASKFKYTVETLQRISRIADTFFSNNMSINMNTSTIVYPLLPNYFIKKTFTQESEFAICRKIMKRKPNRKYLCRKVFDKATIRKHLIRKIYFFWTFNPQTFMSHSFMSALIYVLRQCTAFNHTMTNSK